MIVARIAKLLAVGVLAAVAWAVLARDVADAGAAAPDGAGATLWYVGRGAALAAEALAGLLFSGTTLAMLRRLRGGAAEFGRARRFILKGTLAALALWFGGVLVANAAQGDPWHAPIWTGQPLALRLYMTALMLLLFINQSDPELPRHSG